MMDVGYKAVALANYLKSKKLFCKNQFDFFIGQITPQYSNKRITPGSIRIARLKYTADFYIENIKNGEILPPLILAWLMDNDYKRDTDKLSPPVFTIEQINERNAETVNIEFEIEFFEDQIITKDPKGIIDYNGEKYALQPPEIKDIEVINVKGRVND